MGAAPAIDARAEALPFDDNAVDGVMACVTIHHWEPPEAGLAEMRRVARGPVVVFTFELDSVPAWQQEYLGEALTIERITLPSMERIIERLRAALASGAWDAEHGRLRSQESFDGSLRLVVSESAA